MLDLSTFWYWLAGGVVLMVLELFAPGVVFLWLGLAAVATGLVVFVVPLSLEAQGAVFAALSVVSVVAGRMVYKMRKEPSDHPSLNRRGTQYIGRVYMLMEDTVDGRGRVKVGDSVWNAAMSDPDRDAKAGSHVKVVSVNGTVLVVEPVAPKDAPAA